MIIFVSICLIHVGQVWLAIFNLLMNKSCRQRYQYDSHRKDILIELRRHFSDILLDQLPLLSDLKRHIEQLAIFDPPPPSSSSVAIIEQVPEMRNSILYQRKKTQSLTSGLLRERQKKAVGPQSTLSTSSTTTKDDTPKIVVIEEVEESELKLRSSTSTQTAPSTTGEVEVAHASLHDNHKASITKDKADDDSPQERDWKAIADAAKKGAFSNDEDARQRDIRRFSENYNLDNLDDMLEMGLLGDDPICGRSGCGKIAVNRCSGCANEW